VEKISTTVARLGFKRFDYVPVTSERSALYALSDFQYRRLIQDLDRQAEEVIHNSKNGRSGTNIRIIDMLHKLRSPHKKSFYCGAAKSFMAVSTTGNLYPCHRFVGRADWIIGNIEGIWNDRYADNFTISGIASKTCETCWARYLCGGGCMYDNFVFSGNLFQPDPRNCAEIKHRIEMAIYVCDRLNEIEKYIE
jgi:uncharacterized protein